METTMQYSRGNFQHTINALRPCLKQNLPEELSLDAHRLIILAHLELAQQDSARYWAENLVGIDYRYQTNPEADPIYFRNLIEEVRPGWRERVPWPVVGGAAITTGVIIYLLVRKSEQPLSLPPPFPEGN